MKKRESFIKIESNFNKNNEGVDADMRVNIYNVEEKVFVHWLGEFLQKLVDEKIISYNVLRKVVNYAVVSPDKDRNKQYEENYHKLKDECLSDILGNFNDMLDKFLKDMDNEDKED